ncbi:hypothetical protein U9M48_044861 [Paspalum notatum var. saurae]|uniref:Uncharacterized protein n=1 Tax=Paspalum notatum var. saurae TaxID=547442 RepID=A0AAQ3XH54_PASNO
MEAATYIRRPVCVLPSLTRVPCLSLSLSLSCLRFWWRRLGRRRRCPTPGVPGSSSGPSPATSTHQVVSV